IEVIVTGSEVEALHLEQNLVKRYRPPFNVRLRDDKSFPYIAVTVADDFPRVMFTRERHRRGVTYFGPYANAKKVRETLDVLNRVFQYRPCEGPKPGRHSGIPCLDYHIERCHAPCVDYISKEAYAEIIDGVINFLSGDTRTIERELEQKMQAAAEAERFEEAARYGFHLEDVEGQETSALLEAFCVEYYGSAPSVPPQIVVPRDAGDVSALEEFLSERRGSGVEVRAAERGEKRRLQELATQNARLALDSESYQTEQKRLR